MNNRAVLLRQARALVDVAMRQSDPERVANEFDWFVDVLRQQPDTARLLANAAIPQPKRADAVRTMAAAAGLTPIVTKLLVIFTEREWLPLLPELAAAYRVRLQERRNVVGAEITTAVPLPAEKAEAVGRRLGELSGKRVVVSTRVDPGIIGGVVARVGGTVYDGSVTGQLARMRQKLVENV